MHISVILQPVDATTSDTLIDILRDAETDEEHLCLQIARPENMSYLAVANGTVIGGATLKWQKDESELIYIATLPQYRGKGYGKAIVNALFQQMLEQEIGSLLVGTGNTSLDNIAFYQKCGFRMDHIRHGYFSYAQTPIWENGILLQDMLVFRINREDIQPSDMDKRIERTIPNDLSGPLAQGDKR